MWSVFFVFLSYLDRNFVKGDLLSRALDAEKESKEMFSMLNGTFCAKMSTVRESFLYQVSDGAEMVRSVVSPAGRLGNCSVIANQIQVKSFMHECRLGLKEHRAGRQLETRFARMDEAKRLCREFKKRSERRGDARRGAGDDSAVQDKVLTRSKRGFTYPGTLWCGAGNMADHDGQLGDFAETDSCCRIHDHCPHVIHAFSSNYGYTNFKWHSICHCDCDNTLRGCLREVNDTSSRVVGQAFFNVIGVPCFEFAYEDQCAERHWYGMCKRYEKFPIAVLKEAVPYDFGGIDVIDELTVAPSKKGDSKKSKAEKPEKPESPTQSTMSGLEEPSLRNVVTAAEDFIKVLATVSTSQSSTADSNKGETQSSEKKKRKNTGKKKKTTKKQKGKGKGKGRKRKQKAEEGAAVSPSGSKAEEVVGLSNFIGESQKHKEPARNTNRVDDSEGKDEPFNGVMKDEPAVDKETVSITSPSTAQKKPQITPSTATTTRTVGPREGHTRRPRKQRRKKSRKIHLPLSAELETNTTDNLRAVSTPTTITKTPTTQPEAQRPVVSPASTPIIIPKVKRNRSKDRGDREGRKKRRKLSSASFIVAAARENPSADNLKAIPLTGAPTVPPVPTTEGKVSRSMDVYRGETSVQGTAMNISVLRRQKPKGLKSRRRKTVWPQSSENPLFHNGSEHVIPVLTTQEKSDALSSPAATSAGETESHREWRLFTAAPFVDTKRHRQTIRQQRKPRRKATAASLRDGASIPKQTERTPMTFTPTPPKVDTNEEHNVQIDEKPNGSTSATPVMSPIQLSIEKAKDQFTRKKRRKAALSVRQQ
ncbi:nascent polypeptide-associated complex subunit alpha, muscle-specific form [Clinocottus analis]|uniref:nascent polypeptide-associated complex subunit alpha, muscle-specific form n=1 Tax=Clinocottus analis TaxID=304258 RepID=UPI0035C0FE97